MEEQLVEYQTAKLTEEKGIFLISDKAYYQNGDDIVLLWHFYDEPGFVCYAPTQNKLRKTLLDNYNIHIDLDFHYGLSKYGIRVHNSEESHLAEVIRVLDSNDSEVYVYDTPEQALEVALVRGLNMV